MIAFLLLLSTVRHGHTAYQTFFSPCEFPSPIYNPVAHKALCESTTRLPFLCDMSHQLLHVNTVGVETAFQRYRPYFDRDGQNSTLAVIVVKHLETPTSTEQVYSQPQYKCLFENECAQMDAELVQGFVSNVKTFLKVYAWKVYERWFAMEEKCSKANILALVVLEGMLNDGNRKIPYVRLHTGESKLQIALGNIQSEANNALVQGWPLQEMLEYLVKDLGNALHDLYELNGEPRDHSVPKWARHVFLACGLLVAFALIIEWYIVRRSKLGIQKSASGAMKIVSGGKSKTHLMFTA